MVGELAQWLKPLPHKQESQRLDPQTHVTVGWVGGAEMEARKSMSKLVCQTTHLSKL